MPGHRGVMLMTAHCSGPPQTPAPAAWTDGAPGQRPRGRQPRLLYADLTPAEQQRLHAALAELALALLRTG